MSDIGLFPPGAMVCFACMILLCVFAVAALVCLLVVWFRIRRTKTSWRGDRFFGYAIGAGSSLIAAGFSIWLITWSGSLGTFSKWIDQTRNAACWLVAVLAVWPLIAFAWNRAHKTKRR